MKMMRRVSGVLIIAFLVAFMVPGLAGAADKCGGKKVDGFVMLIDLSGSRGSGFEMQMSLIDKMQTAVPEYDYKAAIRTFYRYAFGSGADSQLVYGVKTFDREGFVAALKGLEGHTALTPLGSAIAAAGADLEQMPGTKALIIFSDFQWSDRFGDPEKAAADLKAKYPDLAIITVAFSNKKDPVTLATNLAKNGGQIYDASKVMSDEASFNAMLNEIFTTTMAGDSDGDSVNDCNDQCPGTPAGAKVSANGCPIMSLNVQFDTAKWNIRPQYDAKIAEVANFLKANPEFKAMIEGHTDAQGSDQSNQVLSQKRVDSVMNYLVEKFGIEASRLSAKGYGESKPIADNATPAGRQMNRRVEVQFSK